MYSERHFYLNKFEYSTKFKNNSFLRGLEYIYQFSIILPFQLPFPQKSFFTYPQVNNDTITTSFFDISINKPVPHGTYRENEIPTIQSKLSRVEFAYFTNDLLTFESDTMSKVFDECLSLLNNIIISYKVKHGDSSVYLLTKEMIETPIILFRGINIRDWEHKDYLFTINTNLPFIKEELNHESFLEVSSFMRTVEKGDNPFVYVEEMKLESLRMLQIGEYREAILYESMCMETFLFNLFKLLKVESGSTEKDIDQFLNFPRFKGIKSFFQNDYLPTLLNGKWDYRNKKTDIGSWHENAYKLRNKVVHQGYIPSYDEANKCIEADTDFRNWVLKLLSDKQKEFPHTNSLYNQ